MRKNEIKKLAKNLKLEFKNKKLIQKAFVHRSFLNESKKYKHSNERLEYLGDAVIELATSEFLYENYPKYQEGMLTNLRASLVRTTTLAKVAKDLNLPPYILMSKGEEESGGRSNTSLLANTTEAFLGAVYLDQGFPACKKILQKHLFPKLKKIIKNRSFKDHKSLLQEVSQEKFQETPTYQLLRAKGPDHEKEFTMQTIIGKKKYATGKGKSKQKAQEQAAKRTLEMV